MGLHQLFAALRDDLGRRGHATVFHSRSAGPRPLAGYSSLAAVLGALDDKSASTFQQRDELLRALLAEHRRATHAERRSTWAAALLLAFAPMLHTLRWRIQGNPFTLDELDQLVFEGFLDALERCPLDAHCVCQRLRLDTQRSVMRAVAAEQRRRIQQFRLSDEARNDPGFVLFEWWVTAAALDGEERAELEQLLRTLVADAVEEPRLEVVIATRIWDRPLDDVAALGGPMGTREYQRLKRERTRTLTTLRRVLAQRLSPTEPDLALDLSRLRAAS